MCNIITVKPLLDNMTDIRAFFMDRFDDFSVNSSERSKLYIAIDEIVSNIIKFSGASFITMECNKKNDIVYLKFIDDGKFFNPLAFKNVDTSLPLNERKIGGLGIFIVKNSMDYTHYEYSDNNNILTIGLKVCAKGVWI